MAVNCCKTKDLLVCCGHCHCHPSATFPTVLQTWKLELTPSQHEPILVSTVTGSGLGSLKPIHVNKTGQKIFQKFFWKRILLQLRQFLEMTVPCWMRTERHVILISISCHLVSTKRTSLRTKLTADRRLETWNKNLGSWWHPCGSWITQC